MAKRSLYILFIFLIATGCGSPKETQEPNTIIFSFPDRDLGFYRPLLNDFYLENPGITVVLQAVPGNQSGGQTGDVQVVTWDIAEEAISWSASSYIDLNPLIKPDEAFEPDDFFPGVFIPFMNNDELLALPYGMDLDVLYYNRDIFENRAVPTPDQSWNWNNFLDAAARLTGREQNIYGYFASAKYSDSLYFLYQGGGRLLSDESLPELDSPANIEPARYYTRLFSTLNVAPSLEQAQRSLGIVENVFSRGIGQGKAGMWTGAYSSRGLSPYDGTPLAFEYGMEPLPGGQEIFTSGVFEGYAISMNAKNVDACWKLINFLSRKPMSRLIPARQSVAASVLYSRLVGARAAATAQKIAGHTIVVRHDQADAFIKAKKAFLEAVSSIIRLDMTALQALQNAQKSLQP